MFGVDTSELLIVAVLALIFIGPKELPATMRTVGRWVGKIRGMARHFTSGIETMIREAELEEMEKRWREENERIMREFPTVSDSLALPDHSSAASEPGAEASPAPAPAGTGAEEPESQADLANWHAAATPVADEPIDTTPSPAPAPAEEEQYSLLPPEPPSAADAKRTGR